MGFLSMSHDQLTLTAFYGFHLWKKNNFSDGSGISKKHDQSVYPYSFSGSGRHSILQRFDIIFVHIVSLFITGFPVSSLLQKSLFLVVRIIEFRKSIRDLMARDKKLKSIRKIGIRLTLSGKGRNFNRISGN